MHDLTPTTFNEIRQVVHDLCGIALADDKDYLVKSRLEPILLSNRLASYEMLLRLLKQRDGLVLQDQLIEAITTKETSFNRDGHPFDTLRRSILPSLASRHLARTAFERLARPKVRIWCAAVATGQEAYSVAMALVDVLAARRGPSLTLDDFSILASDISACALAAAREGRYSTADVARGVSALQRARYFHNDHRGWIVDASLRRIVDFRRLNLVLPLPELGTFDLILCRNLLIYLDEDARRRLCAVLHAALDPGGILMIGAAESLYGVTDAFQFEQDLQTVFYRKP